MVAIAERAKLNALMEEARRRARRRRVVYACLGLAIAASGAAYLGLQLGGGGGGSAGGVVAPRGFHLVPAQGPVAHAVIDESSPTWARSVDLSTRSVHPAKVSEEVWWDRKTGLVRIVQRVDGQVRSDLVGQTCAVFFQHPGRRRCYAPDPFVLLPGERALPHFGLHGTGRRVGVGDYHGERVTWLEYREQGCRCAQRVGVSARTGMPIVRRRYTSGHVLSSEQVNKFEPTLPAREVSFVVPDGGVSTLCFPACFSTSTTIERSNLSAVSRALGRPPLWLGPRALGHPLRRVHIGVTSVETKKGDKVMPARFVRFDYGTVWLKEFVTRPPWYRSGPAPSKAILDGVGQISLSRGGVLVLVTRGDLSYLLTPTRALALARMLRPLQP